MIRISRRIRISGDVRRFQDAQTQWQRYRGSHCLLAGLYAGSPMYARCPMLLSIDRVPRLRELANQ